MLHDHELRELKHLLKGFCHHAEQLHKAMTSLDTLTASVSALAVATTGLTAAVDTVVTEIGTPAATDAQILSAASLVDAQTAATNAQTARLIAATTPAPTV